RDFLTRQFHRAIEQAAGPRQGSGKSGAIAIAAVGQTVLERSAVVVLPEGGVEVRFTVGLPARGRRILGRQAAALLCEQVPAMAQQLEYPQLDAATLTQHLYSAEDADWLRQQLAAAELVAFVADGAVLPRESGVSDRPLASGLPFSSPASLRVQFDRPHYGPIAGMGIPQGISLIVGGGYHGKSTLLRAVMDGVYNHIPGDGREWVVTDGGAMRLRAEDGRRVASVNISPFINNLPQGQPTNAFSTDNASGSTSQAASLMEAVEVGATALLLDEDTCATNFMIRDRRMALLISPEQEPITPLVDRVEALSRQGISTVMVMGGSGAYFDAATVVIAMVEFVPQDATQQAKAIAQVVPARPGEAGSALPTPRRLAPAGDRPRDKIKVRDLTQLSLDREVIDLSAAQIVDAAQTRAIGYAILQLLDASPQTLQAPLAAHLSQLMDRLAHQGLDSLTPSPRGDLAQFRRFELAAALNRMRSLPMLPAAPGANSPQEPLC
ncbi:MAG: ABC-ATPase domain-containing protein, partial [Cyanobacteria bacterium P01_A01_bin.135]